MIVYLDRMRDPCTNLAYFTACDRQVGNYKKSLKLTIMGVILLRKLPIILIS